MDNWISDLTTELLWVEDIASAQMAVRRLAAQAGVDYFVYGNLRAGIEEPYVDTTYPEAWMAHYFNNRYQFIDPVVIEGRRSPWPFTWRFLLNRAGGLTPAQERLFAEAAEFGICDGFTIPFHHAGECTGLMSMAFRSSERLEMVLDAKPKLRLLGIYYHTAIERLLELGDEADPLSSMERQCLTGIATGHSLWEISGRVHLPEPDIAGALRSAREKLGTETTAQAVAKAIADGLIAP